MDLFKNVNFGAVLISTIVTSSFGVSCYLLLTLNVDLKSTAGEAFLILMGVLSQSFAQVTGYWLGSSAGSSEKTQKLADLANKSPNTTG